MKGTKTETVRAMPIHPTLARVLAEWKMTGWERAYGRKPEADDFVVPARTMRPRNKTDAARARRDDLATLELRHRRGHDLRRTMISLTRADGAREDLLKVCTHGASTSIMDVYTTFPWEALSGEVAKLKISLREGAVFSLIEPCARWRSTPARRPNRDSAVTGKSGAGNQGEKRVTPPGIEPGIAA